MPGADDESGAPCLPEGRPTAPLVRRREVHLSGLPDPRLLGRWRLFRADPTLDFAPNARMEFLPGGRLRYSFDAGGHQQFVMLVFRVEGDQLFTDNPAAPHLATAKFRFGEGETLVLDLAGALAWFLREL